MSWRETIWAVRWLIFFAEEKLAYLRSMSDKTKPIFDKRIFWDVNFEKLDYDLRANFVIERVFERGDVEDICQCRRYYGDEKLNPELFPY